MNPLGGCFINRFYNPGKLTFVNGPSSFVSTYKHTYRARILREFSRVSSWILRAKLWLADYVLRHRIRLVVRVSRRYFSGEEKRRPEISLRSQARILNSKSTSLEEKPRPHGLAVSAVQRWRQWWKISNKQNQPNYCFKNIARVHQNTTRLMKTGIWTTVSVRVNIPPYPAREHARFRSRLTQLRFR